MAKSSGSAVLYTAVYDDVDAALADLTAFEQLHKAELIGNYDAAVVDPQGRRATRQACRPPSGPCDSAVAGIGHARPP